MGVNSITGLRSEVFHEVSNKEEMEKSSDPFTKCHKEAIDFEVSTRFIE
jgi:hypothetical protein